MAVDAAWLDKVRAANRAQLGMAGLGASSDEAIARFRDRRTPPPPPTVPQAFLPPPPPVAPIEIPTYVKVGAGLAITALVLGITYRLVKG